MFFCHLRVWFVLVCVALFAGDTSNLPIEGTLSTSFLQIGENNFSFFSCQARKPYSHKGFRRFQAEKQSGKNFPSGRQIPAISSRKATRAIVRWYVPRDKPKRERTREGKEGRKDQGRNGKEWEGLGKERTERYGNPLPSIIEYPQQSACCFARCFPFKDSYLLRKSRIITAVDKRQAKNPRF